MANTRAFDLRDSAQHQRRILAAERDTVRDGMLDHCLAAGLRDIVEIADRVRSFEVDGRRKLAGLNGDDRSSDSGGTACALGMSDLRFQG